MANEMTFCLSREDRRLFALLCQKDFRPPDNQIRFLIRNEATRQGILPVDANSDTKALTSRVAVAEKLFATQPSEQT